jgi:hypothetical protein
MSWLTFDVSEKHGRCEFCSCDGLLTYIDPLEMWLCFDCQTEYEDADEVMLLSGWIQEVAPGTCRVCGCTAERGCYPVLCYWVEPDLCSNCAGSIPIEEAS